MRNSKDEIVALEHQRCEATSAGDLNALDQILAEDYLHVTGNGSIMDKAGYLAWVKKLARSQQRGDLNVRLYGDTAVVTGDLLNRLQFAEGERLIEAFVTQVARREGQRWRFVSFHITPKGEPAHQ